MGSMGNRPSLTCGALPASDTLFLSLMKRFQTIALNIWSGVAGLITGEVLCEVIPVLPDSVLFHKNWVTLLSQSSLFLGAWMIFGKALLTSQPPNSASCCGGSEKKCRKSFMQLFLLCWDDNTSFSPI